MTTESDRKVIFRDDDHDRDVYIPIKNLMSKRLYPGVAYRVYWGIDVKREAGLGFFIPPQGVQCFEKGCQEEEGLFIYKVIDWQKVHLWSALCRKHQFHFCNRK